VADWDPRKHPRDPRDGQFTESWATAISDQIAGAVGRATSSPNLPRLTADGGLPADTPADGRVDTIDDLLDATAHLGDGTGFGRFDGVEFFIDYYGWIGGDEAQALPHSSAIQIGGGEDAQIIGMAAGEDVTMEGKARWRHMDLREADMSQPPDPAWEYLIDSPDAGESIWWDGGDFDVVDGRWVLEGEPVDDYLEGQPLMGRPAIYPPHMEGLFTHPQKTTVAARLLDDLPAWTGGGYQIYNPDTGTWHTIEEIYQDNPDEEEIELIADGYHLPHLDTSDEIVVRPIPVGD